jgi:hypothetical protein
MRVGAKVAPIFLITAFTAQTVTAQDLAPRAYSVAPCRSQRSHIDVVFH